MSGSLAEISTSAAWQLLERLPGRNRTKADVLVYKDGEGRVAVKDYSGQSWWIRQSVGRALVRRETAAYRAAGEVAGLPRFRGRLDAFRLATDYIEASKLADQADGSVDPARLDALETIVKTLHARGVALADLNHRDVLLTAEGPVYVIDLAMACVLGPRPGRWKKRLFEHFRRADLFALARLRARFTGRDAAAALAGADASAVAWHRRARRVKWVWDRLRGAERLPPVDDHWRF